MSAGGKYPFVKLIIPFLIGIWLGFNNLHFLSDNIIILLSLFAGLIITLAFLYKQLGKHSKWLIALNMILLGTVLSTTKHDVISTKHFSKLPCDTCQYVVVINSDINTNQFNYTAFAKVVSVIQGNKNLPYSGNLHVTINKSAVDVLPQKGSRYLIMANLVTPIEESAMPVKFNFKRYVASHNVFYQAKLKKANQLNWKYAGNEQLTLLNNLSLNINRYITLKLNKNFKPNAGFMQALLIGKRSNVPQYLKDNLATTGVIHVLAVSGLHVGIIYLALAWCFNFIKRLSKGHVWHSVLIIVLLWLYALVTGLSPSVTRAVTMFSFIALGRLIYRQPNVFNAIAVSAFIILLINPYALFQLSFQLSYSAVLGIVYLYPKIMGKYHPKNKALKYCWALMIVSFSAQVATFPITIATFHSFPTYFMVSNLLVLPLVTILLMGGLVFIMFSSLPVVSSLIAMVLNYIIDGINYITANIAELPLSPWQKLYPNGVVLWLMLGTIILLVNYWISKKRRVLGYALVCMILLLTVSTYSYYQISTRQKLVVLADGKSTQVLLINGKNAQLIGNTSVRAGYALNDLADLWKLNCRVVIKRQEQIHQWGDKTFVVIDKTLVLKNVNHPLMVSYIIVAENNSSIDDILTNFSPEKVILGAEVSDEEKAEWKKKVEEVYYLKANDFFEATI